MMIDELVVILRSYPGSTNVRIYSADSEQVEPITGVVFDEVKKELELFSDDTD